MKSLSEKIHETIQPEWYGETYSLAEITHVRAESCDDGLFRSQLCIGDAVDVEDLDEDQWYEPVASISNDKGTNAYGPARVQAKRAAQCLGVPYCE